MKLVVVGFSVTQAYIKRVLNISLIKKAAWSCVK